MLSSTVAPDLPTLPAALPAALHAAVLREPSRRGSLWRRLGRALAWRRRGGAKEADPHAVNGALLACLADLPAIDTRALCQLLAHARSVAELWHLRPEVYRLLSLHHSQAEAERRFAALKPLFDRR